MGPGGGDRAQGRLFRSEDEIKREEESASPSELTPLPGNEVPGCGAGQQGAQRSDAGGSGWPHRGPCGCPRRSPATLCVLWGWKRTWTFTGESRGAPSWLAGAWARLGRLQQRDGPPEAESGAVEDADEGLFCQQSQWSCCSPGRGRGCRSLLGPWLQHRGHSLASSPWARVPALSPGAALWGVGSVF